MVKAVKKKRHKMFDPLQLKSLIDDYAKAQKRIGADLPRQVVRQIVIENLEPALIKAFESVTTAFAGDGLGMLIAQHALANFEFLVSEAIEEAGRPAMSASGGGVAGDPEEGEAQ